MGARPSKNLLETVTYDKIRAAQESRPETPGHLLDWVRTFLGVKIPYKRVCLDRNHCSPAEAFCMSYFAWEPISVWHGSRGFSGKSMMLATLSLTEAITLGTEIKLLGGSKDQSENVAQYFNGSHPSARNMYWECPMAPRHLLAKSNKDGMWLTNGGMLAPLAASQTSVRGGHPQRLRIDEADELKLRLFDAAMGKTMSIHKGAAAAQTTISSTWQHPRGTFTQILNRAKEKGWPIMRWCIARGSIVDTLHGVKPIEQVEAGEYVWTRKGWRPVQHRTYMGDKPTLELKLSNGKTLVCTADHRIAVQGGWKEAGQLTAGDSLFGYSEATFCSSESATDSAVSAGSFTRSVVPPSVLGSVFVPGGAMGFESVESGCGSPTRVLGLGDDLQVVGVAAGSVLTEVIDMQPLRDGTSEEFVSDSMGTLHLPSAQTGVEHTVTLRVLETLPDPAAVQVDNCPLLEVGFVDGWHEVKVLSISRNTTLPVYDIGVYGCHEFLCEGVIVHNCFEECSCLDGGGWLPKSEIARKRHETTQAQWDSEYDLQEPVGEARAINPQAVNDMFNHPDFADFTPIEGIPSSENMVVYEDPSRLLDYYHGTDWAKEQDFTVVVTGRRDPNPDKPDRIIAFTKMNREEWPKMQGAQERQVKRFGGPSAHDAGGVGNVLHGFSSVYSEPVILSGALRREIFAAYILAIENRRIISPMIRSLYDDHKFCTYNDLYGTGHPPDGFVAGALAWYARGNPWAAASAIEPETQFLHRFQPSGNPIKVATPLEQEVILGARNPWKKP